MDNQRQKCPCRYICRKPLGFSCFSRVPEHARKSTTVNPFPSASLFSFACVSFHNFNKPQPLRLDVFVHCAAALGGRHNGTCQQWGAGRWWARGCRREAEGGFCQEGVFATFDANHFGRVNADMESSERAFHVNSDEKKGIPRAT